MSLNYIKSQYILLNNSIYHSHDNISHALITNITIHVTLHHVTSHYRALNRITSHCITLHTTISHPALLYNNISLHFISLHYVYVFSAVMLVVAFKIMDVNNTGFITREDVRRLVTEYQIDITEARDRRTDPAL